MALIDAQPGTPNNQEVVTAELVASWLDPTNARATPDPAAGGRSRRQLPYKMTQNAANCRRPRKTQPVQALIGREPVPDAEPAPSFRHL